MADSCRFYCILEMKCLLINTAFMVCTYFGGHPVCGRQLLKGSSDCCLLASTPLCISSLSVARCLSDFQQKEYGVSDGVSQLRLGYTGLECLSGSSCTFLCSHLLALIETVHFTSCLIKITWQRMEASGLWLTASKELRLSVQLTHPNNFGSWKEIAPQLSSERTPGTANIFPEAEEPARLLPELTYRSCALTNVFLSLTFRIISYAAIGN